MKLTHISKLRNFNVGFIRPHAKGGITQLKTKETILRTRFGTRSFCYTEELKNKRRYFLSLPVEWDLTVDDNRSVPGKGKMTR